ncbi:hypothetical protein DYI26_14250 [Halomonas litopenaei]|nr:hypothetical protein [Halomonas litopenaei]
MGASPKSTGHSKTPFDVFANPSAWTKRMYPYLLDIQSDTLSALSTRIVVPVGRPVMTPWFLHTSSR